MAPGLDDPAEHYLDLPWLGGELPPILEAAAPPVPVLGPGCGGVQLLI
jgi:hypothetical protein